MGFTGELVRSVFSRNKSSNGRSDVVDKRRWGNVRSYLCGEEFYSAMAEEDSTSVKSSEVTVTQPLSEPLMEKGDIQSEESKQNIPNGKQDSISKLFHEEDAAIVIQSAFRRFLAKCRNEEIKSKDGNQEPIVEGTWSPSRKSLWTSIEVQTGNSVEVFSVQEGSTAVKHRLQTKPRTQISKIKEDWDDSTVSSNVSKMRNQNRLEAMTRRERALAYAFSQQLRICSKRKQSRANGGEQNMSWSWLERWMATRIPESTIVENSNQRSVIQKRLTDFAGEEKESCGSNEVPVHRFECLSASESSEKDGHRPSKNSLKTEKNISRRKTVPSYQLPKECAKGSKKDTSRESGKGKNHTNRPPGGKKLEIKGSNATTQQSPNHLIRSV